MGLNSKSGLILLTSSVLRERADAVRERDGALMKEAKLKSRMTRSSQRDLERRRKSEAELDEVKRELELERENT